MGRGHPPDAAGKFLYASERTTSTLAAFRSIPGRAPLTPIDSYPPKSSRAPSTSIRPACYPFVRRPIVQQHDSYASDKTTGKLTTRRISRRKNPNWVEIVSFARELERMGYSPPRSWFDGYDGSLSWQQPNRRSHNAAKTSVLKLPRYCKRFARTEIWEIPEPIFNVAMPVGDPGVQVNYASFNCLQPDRRTRCES